MFSWYTFLIVYIGANIKPNLKRGYKMILYKVTFISGDTAHEYAEDVADLKQFFARCYPHLVIAKIELF